MLPFLFRQLYFRRNELTWILKCNWLYNFFVLFYLMNKLRNPKEIYIFFFHSFRNPFSHWLTWESISDKMSVQGVCLEIPKVNLCDNSPLSNMILWIFPWIFAWVYPRISACCSLRNLGYSQPYKWKNPKL